MYYSRVSTTLVACDVPLLSIVTTYTPAAKSASDYGSLLCHCNAWIE
ncbi:MAG: hypothetical protein Q4Q28_00375 [Bacteroidales bacterium]|nr:hypothetical protein [Bacteroidales bacterium]MEE0906727.1 hypothetical protein [Muribaculaceae bacterium]